MTESAAAEAFGVCAACDGSRWRMFLVKYGKQTPTSECRPCLVCNPQGKLPVGITLFEPGLNGEPAESK